MEVSLDSLMFYLTCAKDTNLKFNNGFYWFQKYQCTAKNIKCISGKI
jgi:hypothetical protein